MTLAPQLAAIEDRIREQGLHVGARATYPYVLVYPSTPMRSSMSMADRREATSVTFNTLAVADDRDICVQVVDRLDAALGSWRPAVAGRMAWKVDHTWSRPVGKSEELADRDAWEAADTWVLLSVPAPVTTP